MSLPDKFAFVDVETTGTSPNYGRVIELAIYRMENQKIVDRLETLLDPEVGVPNEIISMTGIRREDLESAPTFRSVADEVAEILDGAVFVAHNARFDYAFIRSEFRRLGISFTQPTLCTAKLLRRLRPDLQRHNLDVLIEAYELECEQRHRAGPDAKALADFFQVAPGMHGIGFWDIASEMLKRPSWPANLSHMSPEMLPETPGVYIFKDKDEMPIYVGKSKNIRDRVLGHFLNDGESKELKMAQVVSNIEYIQTAGEMGALILESQLVKKYLPLFNRQLRKSAQMFGAFEKENESGYKSMELRIIDQILPDDIENLIGVFKSKRSAMDTFRKIAQDNKMCPRVLGLETGKGSCFWRQLEQCSGACDGLEPAWKYNAKFVEAVHKLKVKKWPYDGPVTMYEEFQGKQAGWVVDRWCLVKHVSENEEGSQNQIDFEPVFDWDTYKILKKFVLGKSVVHYTQERLNI